MFLSIRALEETKHVRMYINSKTTMSEIFQFLNIFFLRFGSVPQNTITYVNIGIERNEFYFQCIFPPILYSKIEFLNENVCTNCLQCINTQSNYFIELKWVIRQMNNVQRYNETVLNLQIYTLYVKYTFLKNKFRSVKYQYPHG